MGNKINLTRYLDGRCMLPGFAIPDYTEAGSFDYVNFFNNKYPRPSKLEEVKQEESEDFVPDSFAISDEAGSQEACTTFRERAYHRRTRRVQTQPNAERFVLTPEKPKPQPEDWQKYAQIALPRLPRYTKQYMLQAFRKLRDAGYDIGTVLNLPRDSMEKELRRVRAIIYEKGSEYCPQVIAEITRNNTERRRASINSYMGR